MTVHPFPSAVPGDRDPIETGPWPGSDETDGTDAEQAGIADLFDLLADRAEEPMAGLADLFDDLVELPDRFGSFERDHRLAHRAVTPGLLAGFCWLPLELSQAFHAALFQLLEDIGDFDGLIATSSFFAGARRTHMEAADAWLAAHPAPPDEDDSPAARNAVAAHSQELAVAVGSNPSLTFASAAALREQLLDGVLEVGGPDLEVTGQQIDWLADLTLRVLAELRHDVAIVGGVRVWASAPLRGSN